MSRMPSTHMTQTQSSQLRTRKRTKTFTGCWTCRARRVKCDEAQPICDRCVRAGRECEGYDIRLCWKGSEANNSFRVGIELDTKVDEILPDDLNDMIDQCCFATTDYETKSFGPFSVFSIVSNADAEEELDLPVSIENFPMSVSDRLSPTTGQTCITQPESQDSVSNSFICSAFILHDTILLDKDYCLSSDDTRVPELMLESNLSLSTDSESWPFDLPHNMSPGTTISLESLVSLETSQGWSEPRSPWPVSPPLYTQPSQFSMPRQQSELIHHWLIFMCKNMVPIDSLDNPYRVLYLRLASQSRSSASKGHQAVFHGICAAAAHNLNNLRHMKSNTSPAWHAHLALQKLQQALMEPKQMDYVCLLAAIAMCIVHDTMTGQAKNWRAHIQAALKILAEPLVSGLEGTYESHVLAEQYICLAVLGNIDTDYDLCAMISQLPCTEDYLSKQHSVTKSLLSFVAKINKLSKQATGKDPLMLDQLELEIYLDAMPVPRQNGHGSSKQKLIYQHYAFVWYYAKLLHFHRCIRHKHPAELRDIVHEALSHLEAAEDIATNSDGCILLWPCLVIASECYDEGLQRRALDWFSRKDRHGFGNVGLARTICREYWNWRDETSGELLTRSWQDFIYGTEYDVVPV